VLLEQEYATKVLCAGGDAAGVGRWEGEGRKGKRWWVRRDIYEVFESHGPADDDLTGVIIIIMQCVGRWWPW
jgi:hypothetical protein